MEQLGATTPRRNVTRFTICLTATSMAFAVACHKHVPPPNDGVDPGIIAFFADTTVASVFAAKGPTFALQTPAQRQAFRALLSKEHQQWLAAKPSDYRFLLRVECFCPGVRGWELIEVRRNQPLRAWDKSGKPAPITDWNTVSIDQLYDNLERFADRNAEVQIAFDPRWHFPTYVRTNLRMPDTWSITQARALRPL